MKILVLSDSHGNRKAVGKIFDNMYGYFDKAVFLGDGENDFGEVLEKNPDIDLIKVRGNCDRGIGGSPLTTIIEADGVRIFVTHGNMYGVKSGLGGLAAAAKLSGCEMALFGHTHCRTDERIDEIYCFNPGSCAIPHDGNAPSYGVIHVSEQGIVTKFMEI